MWPKLDLENVNNVLLNLFLSVIDILRYDYGIIPHLDSIFCYKNILFKRNLKAIFYL